MDQKTNIVFLKLQPRCGEILYNYDEKSRCSQQKELIHLIV